jgi:hypothetical protein
MSSSITRQKIVMPVIETVTMTSFQVFAPNNKIIAYSRNYSTAARQFVPEDLPVSHIPQLP